ncbi:AlkZ family DNA glycosylase [Plantactinospora sp. S1510]|uniref:AlkZ family DNA glycosylase n=1 Tax=Plantactinospora alkalitolerans TaxID=2789879 RepID=A0ABS0H4T6_9ACTN|nr:winged helix DNA-binding domain-containing protein [Plantactinospora alkalitolerans]MBF9133476.1 AlkZ family DNA glycosylase [Plantactinospora alkalitolerans]
MRHLSFAQVCARRLDRQGLISPLPGAAAVAARLGGVHAQVLSAAELSIGLRARDTTRADVRKALWTERSLVKTRGPRFTVHLLATEDLPMWTGALSALPVQPHKLLTEKQAGQVVEAIADALRDAELTTDELTEAVVTRTGPWAGDRVMDAFQGKWPRWIEAMSLSGRRGAMCFGPNRGRQTTYTNPARWLPGFQPAEARPALTEVVRRYLYAYGPATPAHFAQWLAAPKRWAAELFDSLGAELEQVSVAGTSAWVVAGDTAVPSGLPDGVRLLPYFDAYPVGCFPREHLFPGRAAERALAGGQAGNFPVLLVDGVVAGVWHQRRSGRRIHVTVEPLNGLTAGQRRDLDDQVQRIGEILEGTPELTIGEVSVGPHA